MTTGVLAEGLRARLNGHLTTASTPETMTEGWRISKRDHSQVPFDANRIRAAVTRCFNSCHIHLPQVVDQIVRNSVRELMLLDRSTFDVEEVQRIVIRQIWISGQFDAAEHYQNYREQHRAAREIKRGMAASTRTAQIVAEDSKHFPLALQYYQFVSKFARWRDQEKRRETWREACDRVMGWFRGLERVRLSDDEWAELDASLYGLETCCAMRVVQMAGPALERCHIGAYNCAATPLDDLRSFAELLYVLMAGSGCGFSVEDCYISQLPRVKRQTGIKHTFVVDDDTEGWCDALLYGLERWFDGEDVDFDMSKIRKKGSRLKTKGGRSSGPEPLIELLAFSRNLILRRQGKVLTDLDCHDLACMIGKIVQVGGVRRAATISISDLDSVAMREAKSGNWYEHAKQRTMANNSAVYDGRPDIDTFMAEFTSLIRSKSGERGIFNRKAVLDAMPRRRNKNFRFLTNPCGEINFRPRGLCNLSIVVARPWDTPATLRQKVRMATYWGCMQKTATKFQYVRDEWRQNAEEEALIGVDITGHADCPYLRFGAPGRSQLLRELKQIVAETDAMLSERFGVNRSAADTCVKPSGDSSVFFHCASGCSPWFDRHVMRWVREQAGSPVAQFLMAEGVPCTTSPEDPGLMVFGFPRKAPAESTLAPEMTALDQLNNWLEWKENWAEHSVSCTVYVDEHEWPDVMAWVWANFDKISGLSFLPRDNGIYAHAPNERVSAEQFAEISRKFPKLNWAKLTRYEDDDFTEAASTYACVGGACAL